MTPVLKKVIAWIAGILATVIASLIVIELTRTGPDMPEPPVTPSIHSRGTSHVPFKGVSIPPPQPNVSGPFVFQNISLDEGAETSIAPFDVSVELNAREQSVAYTFPRAVDAGTVAVSYEKCRSLLEFPDEPLRLKTNRFPDRYVCLETREGRISLFRITGIRRAPVFSPGGGDNIFDLTLEFEYTTWNWE